MYVSSTILIAATDVLQLSKQQGRGPLFDYRLPHPHDDTSHCSCDAARQIHPKLSCDMCKSIVNSFEVPVLWADGFDR